MGRDQPLPAPDTGHRAPVRRCRCEHPGAVHVGSLASFGARAYKGSKGIYGTTGNSFLAIVEFGDRVSARAITAGGQSGDPKSPHFNDQAARYASGNLRDVYFYPDQLKAHTERAYHPGE